MLELTTINTTELTNNKLDDETHQVFNKANN